MTRRGALPAVLRTALAVRGGRCYRHCDGAVTPRRLPSSMPGVWTAYACPLGVVSVTSYAAWGPAFPTAGVRQALRRWARPATLARPHDLRAASRHGPELGRPAERFLAKSGRRFPIRVVYWRVYPFKARDGSERRLFVCLRRTHPGPVFFVADPALGRPPCPACGTGRPGASRTRGARTTGSGRG
jgi:hypothetical protein